MSSVAQFEAIEKAYDAVVKLAPDDPAAVAEGLATLGDIIRTTRTLLGAGADISRSPMKLSPWLESTRANFIRDKVKVIPNPLDGSRRILGGGVVSNDTPAPGFYTKEITVLRAFVPFEIITSLDVVGLALDKMCRPPGLPWTDKLHNIEMLANEIVVASSPGMDVGSDHTKSEMVWFDFLMPFGLLLQYHNLKIRLTLEKHPDLPFGSPVRPDRWMITLHGGNCGSGNGCRDAQNKTPLDWMEGPYKTMTVRHS
uniref:Uncharacterized protein n=1 Tax=Marseillevirus LCMAC103 TaxID=2506604 RepID=A0A481YU81_9VIRU|nr:MAG: hypothetical protein LCMAC103_00510 [Marseillevirus LCMAC103]